MESQSDSAQWVNIIQATKPPIWYGIAVSKSHLNYSRKEKGQYLWVLLESKKKNNSAYVSESEVVRTIK